MNIFLKQLRKNAGMSQAELGLELGYYSKGTVCLLEKGKMVPSVDMLKRYSEIFDIPITAFFEAEDITWKDEEIKLLSDYKKLSEEDQKKVLEYAELLKNK